MYRARNEIPGGGQEGQVLTYSRGPQWATPTSSGGSPLSYSYFTSGSFTYVSNTWVAITWSSGTVSNPGGWTESSQDLVSTTTGTFKLTLWQRWDGFTSIDQWRVKLNGVSMEQATAVGFNNPTNFFIVSLITVLSVVPSDVVRVEYRRSGNGTNQARTFISLENL